MYGKCNLSDICPACNFSLLLIPLRVLLRLSFSRIRARQATERGTGGAILTASRQDGRQLPGDSGRKIPAGNRPQSAVPAAQFLQLHARTGDSFPATTGGRSRRETGHRSRRKAGNRRRDFRAGKSPAERLRGKTGRKARYRRRNSHSFPQERAKKIFRRIIPRKCKQNSTVKSIENQGIIRGFIKQTSV